MEFSNATAVCHSQLSGHGTTVTSFGKPPNPQLFAGLGRTTDDFGSLQLLNRATCGRSRGALAIHVAAEVEERLVWSLQPCHRIYCERSPK